MHLSKTGTLDTLGLLTGTDKASLSNNYLHVYESMFAGLRDQEFDLIEIGVFRGESMKLWETYFPKARIIGVDINENCRKYAGGRVTIEIGSQCDLEFLDRLKSRYRPLVIIDDGSHIAEHIQFTFEALYPSLLACGYYIVEDTYMHFGAGEDRHRGNTPVSFRDYFSELALSKIRQWIDPAPPGADFRHYWFHNTEQISFAKSLVMIRKKPDAISADDAVKIAEDYCATKDGQSPRALFGAACVMMAVNGPLDRAEALMRRAVAGDPKIPEFHYRFGEILSRQKRFEEAIAAMSAAAELAPNDPLYWERLAIYHARLNRDEMACEFMRKSIALHQNPHSYRFLSETLSRMGQHGEAVEALTRAVQIAAGTPMAAEWQRQLDGLKTEAGSVP